MSEINLAIGIEVDGQKLVLTESAAKELYEKLKAILEGKKEIQYVPYPVTPYYQPVYIPVAPPLPYTTIIYSNTGSIPFGSANVTVSDGNISYTIDSF